MTSRSISPKGQHGLATRPFPRAARKPLNQGVLKFGRNWFVSEICVTRPHADEGSRHDRGGSRKGGKVNARTYELLRRPSHPHCAGRWSGAGRVCTHSRPRFGRGDCGPGDPGQRRHHDPWQRHLRDGVGDLRMTARVEVPEVTSWSIALQGESLRREDGQALVEYTLILGVVTVVAIAALSALGDSVIALLQAVTSALNTVI